MEQMHGQKAYLYNYMTRSTKMKIHVTCLSMQTSLLDLGTVDLDGDLFGLRLWLS